MTTQNLRLLLSPLLLRPTGLVQEMFQSQPCQRQVDFPVCLEKMVFDLFDRACRVLISFHFERSTGVGEIDPTALRYPTVPFPVLCCC